MEAVANCALESGAAYLGVAFTEEGVRLRLAGITAPILLLGATDEDHMDDVIRHSLMPTVFTIETLQLLPGACGEAQHGMPRAHQSGHGHEPHRFYE